MTPRHQAALQLASEHRLLLIPLEVREKRPAFRTGPNHQTLATNKADIINGWWDFRDFNIGLPCTPNRLAVIDVDGPLGQQHLLELEATHGPLPTTWVQTSSRTDRPSTQYIFRWPNGEMVPTSRISEQLEVRAHGAQIVVTPSIHPTGSVYQWLIPPSDVPEGPPELPLWVLEELTKPPQAAQSPPQPRQPSTGPTLAERRLDGLVAFVAQAPEGDRNNRLNHAAYTAARIPGVADNQIVDRLTAAAHTVGLEPRETEATIRSGIAAGHADGPDPEHVEPGAIGIKLPEPPQPAPEQLPIFRLIPAGEFLFHRDHAVAPIWGSDEEVIWSASEHFLITAKPGVGKTTLAQQIVIRRIGLVTTPLLGYPVTPDDRPVVYIAADRPAQIARSMLRMVDPGQEKILNERLLFHEGYLPKLIEDDPHILFRLAEHSGCGTIVVDSLKDIARSIDEPASGQAINAAYQELVREGIQIGTLHHQRKATAGNRRPKTIDDLYGAGQIAWGAGGVLCLWGDPTDPLPELIQLKKPAGDGIGPWPIQIDWDTGNIARVGTDDGDIDPVRWVYEVAKTGGKATVMNYATRLHGDGKPPDKIREKARRKLDRAVGDGHLAVIIEQLGSVAQNVYKPKVEITK